ncbi:MAG TPA: GNAT family N-acetyltransferase [Thermoleophilia bacterium]|nr:GNAT family N-acetyltransferase [Thermoleophilia bacterium]
MTRMKVAIRTMRSGDESMLLYLAEETLHPLAAGTGHPERYDPGELLALLSEAAVFVAEAEGEIAGYVVVDHVPEALEVRCLCVNPAFEAQAVAHQLVDWVEGVAFAERLGRLRVLVPAADERSQHLYRGHEFVAQPAADRPEMIVLEKRLLAD